MKITFKTRETRYSGYRCCNWLNSRIFIIRGNSWKETCGDGGV